MHVRGSEAFVPIRPEKRSLGPACITILLAWSIFINVAHSRSTLAPPDVNPATIYNRYNEQSGQDSSHSGLYDTTHGHPLFWDGYTTAGSDSSIFLYQNYPNPFSGSTVIIFQIVDPSLYGLEISVIVYSELGTEAELLYDDVADDAIHSATFDGAFFQSGFFLCVARCGGHTTTRLMNLVH